MRAFLALFRCPDFRAGLLMAMAAIGIALLLWAVDAPLNSFTISSALILCAIILFPTLLWIGLFLVGRDTSVSLVPSSELAVVEYTQWYNILDWPGRAERCGQGRVIVSPEGLYFIPLIGQRRIVEFSDMVLLESKLYWSRRYYKLRRRSTGKIVRFYVPENLSAVWQEYFDAAVGPMGRGTLDTR